MSRLLAVEIRRYTARRLVRGLVGAAVVVTGVVAVAVYAANEPLSFTPEVPAVDDPRFLTSIWPEGAESEGYLMIPAVLLALFAFVAGASMTGAEWRAGTMTTILTWEPRRGLLLTAKIVAAGLLATAIAAVLTMVFAAAFVPTVLLHGSTVGADGSWWGNAIGGWLRIAATAGLMAMLGAALASLGRNATAAIAGGLGWIAVGEAIVRVLRPRWNDWLIGENLGAFLTGTVSDGALVRTAVDAGLTMSLYAGLATIAAVVVFRRRDVAGAS